jgi:hypothetical protein
MARNEFQSFRAELRDPAHVRAGADSGAHSWHAFANLAVASALVVAVVVSALALIEAVLSDPAARLARHAPPEWQNLHANAQ